MKESSRRPDPEAHRHYVTGDYERAIQLQIEVVNRELESGRDGLNARKLLSLYAFTAGNYELALAILDAIQPLAPDDVEILENRGVILRKMNRSGEATDCLLAAHRMAPDRHNICDALSHCFGSLGEVDQVQKFGRLSLELKDREAARRSCHWDIPEGKPPAFDPSRPERNIISFSLWGRHPRYLEGALRNAMAARDIYPAWTCRFYCDTSVPLGVRHRLGELGAQVVMRPSPASFFEGLLWRFEVAGDSEVDRWLVRDCDSVVNVKERVAVDAWLASDRWFHAMRDFVSHTEVILAGMWGGARGVLPPVAELRGVFRPSIAPTRTFDQLLLREVVWPTVRRSVLIHDSVYTGCLGSVPFPPYGELPANRHVGQNEAAVGNPLREGILGPGGVLGLSPFVLGGSDGEAVDALAAALARVPGIERQESVRSPEEAERAVTRCSRPEVTHPVFRMEAGESFDAGLASAMPGALFVFLVKRPARGGETADAWAAQLEEVARFHRACRDRVELVRWEDLAGAADGWKRLLEFLGAPASADRIESLANALPASGETKPPGELSPIAAKWMKRLRYLEEGGGAGGKKTGRRVSVARSIEPATR